MNEKEYAMREEVREILERVRERISRYCRSLNDGECHAWACHGCELHKVGKSIMDIHDSFLEDDDKPQCSECGKVL